MVQGAASDIQITHSDELSAMLRAFPVLLVAGSRWPVYEALQHFSTFHAPTSQRSAETLCQKEGPDTGIDWGQLLAHAIQFSRQGMLGLEPGQGSPEHTLALKTVMDALTAEPGRISDAAQDECPLGFLFLCVVQMTAAAMRLTGRAQIWAESVDKLLASMPYFMVSGSQWPIYHLLGMLSAMFQRPEYSRALGSQFHHEVHRWEGTHPMSKRFRSFGDLRLLPEELMPFGFDHAAFAQVEALSTASPADWLIGMTEWSRGGKLRPIFSKAIEAIMQVFRASQQKQLKECGYSGISSAGCAARGCTWDASGAPACQLKHPKRKVLLTTFMWGQRWSRLIPSFVAWMHKLRLPTIVIAMGQTCRKACETAAEANGGWGSSLVGCWDPFSQLVRGPRRFSGLWKSTFALAWT